MKRRIISTLLAMSMAFSTAGTLPAITAEESGDGQRWCHEIGDENCTSRRILGDIDGDYRQEITIFDALEIFKYRAGIASELDAGPGSCAWNAALIVGCEEPTVADAHEILFCLTKQSLVLSGGAAPTVLTSPDLFKVKIDKNAKTINLYNTAPLNSNTHCLFELTISLDGLKEKKIANEKRFLYGLGFLIPPTVENGYLYNGAVSVPGKPADSVIPANTLVLELEIDGDINVKDITVNSDSVAEVIDIYIGDTDRDDEITVLDSLEILKYLVGMTSTVTQNDSARTNALITKSSKDTGNPTIHDALEILKYLVNINGVIKTLAVPAADNTVLFGDGSEELHDLYNQLYAMLG